MVRVGIDVGGTGIQVGIIGEDKSILAEGSIPTRTDIPFEEQVQHIVSCVTETAASAGIPVDQIESVGAGM